MCCGGQGKGGPDGEPDDHALGRSRGGFGTKIHLVCDSRGCPIAVDLSAGQVHESKKFDEMMAITRVPQPRGRPRTRPNALSGDKAYSSKKIRDWLKGHKIESVIPTRKDEAPDDTFDREKYRRRNIIERCIGWLKEARRVATRYEKLAVSFASMIKLAIIRRILLWDLPDSA